ncbi:MAG: flagellar biosynthesis regulator FlaF [Rhodospirillales bacterium]|nr:flagellar biosynthesis regulator FlaF [Rhodospirillales bacterium]
MSVHAYTTQQNRSETARQIEYRAFATVTAALARHAANPGSPEFATACYDNKRLWIVLQADLAAEGNQLPTELRAALISLSIWAIRYTAQVERGQAPVEPLIAVNRNVMQGLADPAPEPQG